eukprot:tig00000144_g9011.t1
MAEELANKVLAALADGPIADSGPFAENLGIDHKLVDGALKSLSANEYVVLEQIEHKGWALTAEGEKYASGAGSPEAQVFNAIPADGIQMPELEKALGEVAKIGFAQGMKNKWFALDKATKLVKKSAESIVDSVAEQLRAMSVGKVDSTVDVEGLKKRKLVSPTSKVTYKVARGPKYRATVAKQATDLTDEMLATGAWRETEFKEYNFSALGRVPQAGHLHPLLKVREQFRRIFLDLGFEEMPTNQWVESSFWNFDALFQPQQHPARDSHDTFFTKQPAETQRLPADYVEKVKAVHEKGGHGSIGYRYDWSLEESKKNLLRTHTTAVSSRMLYALAHQPGGFQPRKYFSIDRVFRNENLDATHLAEFHQIEGLIADRNLHLGNLKAVIRQFFARLGLTELRFKPAYNPYTEPSMEVFAYMPALGKWVEVGNSGVFRPEMLLPMGLPPDVRVIAWGLSLERPTMILYGINNIRRLFGHTIDLGTIASNPLCRLEPLSASAVRKPSEIY